MGIGWSLGFALLTIFCDVFFVIFGSKNFKKRTGEKFSILCVFPSETNITERFFDNSIANYFIIASTIISVAFYSTFTRTYKGYYLFIIILGIIGSLVILGLSFFTFKHIKKRLITVIVGLINLFLIGAATFLLGLQLYNETLKQYYIMCLIFTGLVLLCDIALMLNPKFRYDMKLEERDGGYKRKPFYVSCISEWLMIALFEISKFPIILLIANV